MADTKTGGAPTTQPPKPADRPAGPGNPGGGAPGGSSAKDKDKDRSDESKDAVFGKDPFGGGAATSSPKPSSSGAPKGPGASGGDPLKMPESKVPPRPAGMEVTAFSQTFTEARQGLDQLLGEENRKFMELKQLNMNLDQALSAFESEARRTRSLLEKNEAAARDAERMMAEGQNLEKQQDDLETQVAEAREKLQALIDRAEALKTERAELEAQRNEVKDLVAKEQEANAEVKAETAALKARRDALTEETTALNQAKVRVEEQVGRLQRLREEFLGAISRAKGQQDELMNIPSADDIAPPPAAKAPKTEGSKPAGGDKPKGDKPGADKAGDKADKPFGSDKPAGAGY
jgi:hypothetical protein